MNIIHVFATINMHNISGWPVLRFSVHYVKIISVPDILIDMDNCEFRCICHKVNMNCHKVNISIHKY